MKIYFEDGELRNINQLPVVPDYVVDAKYGISESVNSLNNYFKSNPNCTIYTNSIMAFSNRYAWNDLLQLPEIYIRSGEHLIFTRIDALTARTLREGLNLAKLYIAGEFN